MRERFKYIFSTIIFAFFLLFNAKNINYWQNGIADPFWLEAQKCSYKLNEQLNFEERIAYVEAPVSDRSNHDSTVYLWGTRLFLAPTIVDFNPSDLSRYRFLLFFQKDNINSNLGEQYSGHVILSCGYYSLLLRQP